MASKADNRKRKDRNGGRRVKRKRQRPRPTEDIQHEILVQPLELANKRLVGRIRIVKPYPYTFATFAKARWIGRTVLDVYHTEFGAYPKVASCRPTHL